MPSRSGSRQRRPKSGIKTSGPGVPVKSKIAKELFKFDKGGNIIGKVSRTEAFMKEYIKNGGNASRAALAIGEYPSALSAAQGGNYYLDKAKKMGLYRISLEKKGYHLGKLMDIALEKMEESDKPGWWDRIMKMANYEDFVTKAAGNANVVVNTNIFDAHRKLTSEYVEGEVVEEESDEPDEIKDED